MIEHDLGSDDHLRQLLVVDPGRIEWLVRLERARILLEEWKLLITSPAKNEPGRQYPDPDEAPPADEPHDEFDPLPPATPA